MVEVEDLFAEGEVLEESRATRAVAQRVLVVGDRGALTGREDGRRALRNLMGLAP